MYNFLPVFAALSRVLIVFSVMFLVPWAWSWWGDEHRLQEVWLGSFGVTLLSGLGLMWYTQSHRRELMPKDGFMLVNLVWAVLPAYAALPLWVGIPDMSWTDAYFEAVSGLTATGATVLSGLDTLPLAINVWRCFLQLFWGLGIMLLVVAILPLLGLGGVQLYKAETPGPMKDAKLTPRIAETARGLWGVYFVLSASCFLAYRWAGMSWSDAFMHMSTTVSLGGFSSHDASLGFWDSTRIESVAMVFMLLAGVSFARYFIVWRSRSLITLVRDVEVRAYFGVLLVSVGWSAPCWPLMRWCRRSLRRCGCQRSKSSRWRPQRVTRPWTTPYGRHSRQFCWSCWVALSRVQAQRVAASKWCA